MKYVNYNSTFPSSLNGGLNFSDKAYTENIVKTNDYLNIISFIKTEFNIPEDSKVILTSGASEGCATCFHWIEHYSKYGVVYGSELDHETVKLNAENYNLRYKKLNIFTKEESIILPDDCSAVMITLVSGTTGEIYPVNKLKFDNYISEFGNGFYNAKEYKPLIIGDITQAIGKTNETLLDFDYNIFDAFYFSLHKIGCSNNTGVLVINSNVKFIPLIGGLQQNTLRGGTMDINLYTPFIKQLTNYKDTFNEQGVKKLWKMITDKLEKAGIEHYKPRLEHLYNTILINTWHCNLKLINDISTKYNIYIGTSSACALESKDIVPTIRLSFLTGKELDEKDIDNVIKMIVKSNKEFNEDVDEQ